jgi:hypothetical protein
MRGVLNIVIGLVLVAGGLSGRLVLIGTNSGAALAVIRLFLIGLGGYRMLNRG